MSDQIPDLSGVFDDLPPRLKTQDVVIVGLLAGVVVGAVVVALI